MQEGNATTGTDSGDHSAVREQIGRDPRGTWSVSKRCGCGLPQVIETEPLLDDGTPFPTMWWLTCRQLVKAVSKLESEGWMARMNGLLAQDEALRDDMDAALASYNRSRDDIKVIESPNHPGGWPGKVKCLHAHVAHQLMTGDNPVGEAALRELGWSDPQERCV